MSELFDYFDKDQLKSSCEGCTKAEEEVKFLLDHITNIFLENPSKFLGIKIHESKPYNSLEVFNHWAQNFDHDATHIKCSHLKEKVKYLVYKLLNKKASMVNPLKRKFDDGLIDMLKSLKRVAIDVYDNQSGVHRKWKKMIFKSRTALYTKPAEVSDLEEFPFQKTKRFRKSPGATNNEFNSPTLPSDELRRSQRTLLPTSHCKFLKKQIPDNSPTLPDDKVNRSQSKNSSKDILPNELNPPVWPKDKVRSQSKNISKNILPSGKGRRSQRTLLPTSNREYLKHRIPVGPSFQADLPDWTGRPIKNNTSKDSKWLGTQIWPAKGDERKTTVKVIGKGIQLSCKCKHRGSASCIKYHVRKERHHFRSYLGSSFDDMGFNEMGEGVARSWTEEEQVQFEDIVKESILSCEGKSFLELALERFTWKRKDIVSYYYNVFLLRKMGMQTRKGKTVVESSDDEDMVIE